MKTQASAILLLTLLVVVSPLAASRVSAKTDPIIIKAEPQHYTAPAQYVNETFDVNVTIANVDASARLVGVQFRLTYSGDLLEVLNVTEGPFLAQFNQTPVEPYTWFGGFIKNETYYGPNVLVGALILPTEHGQYPGPFPQGNGTI